MFLGDATISVNIVPCTSPSSTVVVLPEDCHSSALTVVSTDSHSEGGIESMQEMASMTSSMTSLSPTSTTYLLSSNALTTALTTATTLNMRPHHCRVHFIYARTPKQVYHGATLQKGCLKTSSVQRELGKKEIVNSKVRECITYCHDRQSVP